MTTSTIILFGKSFATMLVSFWSYGVIFGWSYAFLIILLLLVHEMGHWLCMKGYGLEPNAPVFVPFVGAYVAMNKLPEDEAIHAWVAYAGPLVGGIGALVIYVVGATTGNTGVMAGAKFGFWLNMLQLIPIKPFDGGFIADVIAKSGWSALLMTIIFVAFAITLSSPITILVSICTIFLLVKSTNRRSGTPPMNEASGLGKLAIGIAYFCLLFGLGYLYILADQTIAAKLSGSKSAQILPFAPRKNVIVVPDEMGSIDIHHEGFRLNARMKRNDKPEVDKPLGIMPISKNVLDVYWYPEWKILKFSEVSLDSRLRDKFFTILDFEKGETLSVIESNGRLFARVIREGSYFSSVSTTGDGVTTASADGKAMQDVTFKVQGPCVLLGRLEFVAQEPIFEPAAKKSN